MRHRLTFVLGAVTALALATGAAWAAIPSTVDSAGIIEVADAGTVTVAVVGTGLEITSVDAAPGWTHEIEVRAGREVEADFTNGSRRIQFNAELEDSEIRARVRERVVAGQVDDSSAVTTGDSMPADDSTSTTVDDTTSTTIEDNTSTTIEDSTSTTMDDSTSSTVDDTTSTTVGDDHGPVGSGSDIYTVGNVATVSISWSDGRMSLDAVSVADGWQVERQEVRADRIRIEFDSDSVDARFEADFHGGSIRVETRVD